MPLPKHSSNINISVRSPLNLPGLSVIIPCI
nr:MAG TPA: hypothetical protein [Bacteriophage sp.]